jgi:hypothetical protein
MSSLAISPQVRRRPSPHERVLPAPQTDPIMFKLWTWSELSPNRALRARICPSWGYSRKPPTFASQPAVAKGLTKTLAERLRQADAQIAERTDDTDA